MAFHRRWLIPLSCLSIYLALLVLSIDACEHHLGTERVNPVSKLVSNLNIPSADANELARKYVRRMSENRSALRDTVTIRQGRPYDKDDNYWMKIAISAAIDCYGKCPMMPFGAVLVNKSSGLEFMRSCNTVYIDSTNHAEMNVMQLAAHYYPGKSQAWWNQLTLYTNAEPCAMCMAAVRWVGIGEVVYGTSISTQSSFGWGSIDISAVSINQHSNSLQTTTSLKGPSATSLTDPYFAWQFNHNASCPPGCSRSSLDPSLCVAS